MSLQALFNFRILSNVSTFKGKCVVDYTGAVGQCANTFQLRQALGVAARPRCRTLELVVVALPVELTIMSGITRAVHRTQIKIKPPS